MLRAARREDLGSAKSRRESADAPGWIESSVALAADHVDHVKGRNDVRQLPSDDHRSQRMHVRKAGRAAAALVGLSAAIAHDVEADFAVAALDGEVDFTRRRCAA